MSETHNLAWYERRKLELVADIKSARDQFDKIIASLEAEWRIADTQAKYITDNIDADKILLAEHVIYVHGLYRRAGEDRANVLEDAIQRLLNGGQSLRTEYVGTKNYDRWSGQSICCSYGCGPRHGSVVFEIGLVRAQRGKTEPLNEQEIDAAVYYLRNIERIQALHESTRQATVA